jgi:haloalkane dehalogenase
LVKFVEQLDLQNITLVVQDWGGLIGLPYVAKFPNRIKNLIIMNTAIPSGKISINPLEWIKGIPFYTWRNASEKLVNNDVSKIIQLGCKTKLSKAVREAYNAPFPDNSYKSAARKFPFLVPMTPKDEAIPYMKMARQELAKCRKPTQIIFSDSDPIVGHFDKYFHGLIPGASSFPIIKIKNAGHFLQEDKGEEIAKHIYQFLESNSLANYSI